jgi:DNA-directed RNA polymerase specialized sigma subunit
MLELKTVTTGEIKGWALKLRQPKRKNELADDDWHRILSFVRGIVSKMRHILPWNDRSPMTFDDWIQVGSIAICKMHLRPDCPPFGTSGYWKLAATYIRTEIRNEVQKLTTQGRNINAVENEVDVDTCTFSSSASHFATDAPLREKETYPVIKYAAKQLSNKHLELLNYLIQGYTRSDFLFLCKLLKVEPKLLNNMWRELKVKCFEAIH